MSRNVAWNVAKHAPRGSNDGREPVSVGLLDQYLLCEWPYSQTVSLIEHEYGNFRVSGRTLVRTRERLNSPDGTISVPVDPF